MSILAGITRGVKKTPHFVAIYGPSGVGKTTFASNAPKPIFLATERGTDQLDVARLRISNWLGMSQALAELKRNNEFQTIVIDSLDHLEPMIFEMVAKDHGKKSIEDIGYAKGYIFALEYWKQFLNHCQELREANKNVILIAHAQIKKFNDPIEGEGFDRYELKLHRKAGDLITETVDALVFAKLEVHITKDANKKVSVISDGNRVLHTSNAPAFDAKNRFGLPEQISLSWSEFDQLAMRDDSEKVKIIRQKIDDLILKFEDETFKKTVLETVTKFENNLVKLEEIMTKLQGKLAQ